MSNTIKWRHPMLELSPEIGGALEAGDPVVALESTIIAHGLPWPDNLALAHDLEARVRATGATPATVGICDGRIIIGLNALQLERIAHAEGVKKVSSRDLATIVALKLDGATTVAATMLCAARAGIRVFATGGIGGVHRDAITSLDISADLIELARTRVAVVCSGAKSILDLPRTLEHLETHGVPVVGYRSSAFPAFHSRHSGLTMEHRLDTPTQVATMLWARDELDLPGGEVVANPIPTAAAIPKIEVDTWIEQALETAAAESVTGKALTPFLLKELANISGGRTIAANVALVRNNVTLAAEIELARAKATPKGGPQS